MHCQALFTQLEAVRQPCRNKMNRRQRSHTILGAALEVGLQSDVSIGYAIASLRSDKLARAPTG